MKDGNGWLVDYEEFEPRATKSKVDPSRWLFDLEYDVPLEGVQVSQSRTVNGVDEGHFYLVAFDYGLRFPFPNFIVEVLKVYGIALS